MTKCNHGFERCGLCHDKSVALWPEAQLPVEQLVKVPGSFAQFGEEAGRIMWQQHKQLTAKEKQIAELTEKLEAIEAASSYTAMTGISHLKLLKDINEIARKAL